MGRSFKVRHRTNATANKTAIIIMAMKIFVSLKSRKAIMKMMPPIWPIMIRRPFEVPSGIGAVCSAAYWRPIGKELMRKNPNTIAMMISYAVYEQRLYKDISHINLYGVFMGANEEYGFQRPACEYWLGAAEALGVKVEVVGEDSSVLKCHTIYGYDREWTFMREARKRKQQLEVGQKDLQAKLEDLKTHYWQQQGAIKDVEHFLRKYE